jgi:predicted RNA polymerase sigma factor
VLGDVTRAEDAASEAMAQALVSWRRVGRMQHRDGWVARVAGRRRHRRGIALRYLADLDEAEVSRALGISVNSVKKHAARGKAALRARLGPMQEVSLALD